MVRLNIEAEVSMTAKMERFSTVRGYDQRRTAKVDLFYSGLIKVTCNLDYAMYVKYSTSNASTVSTLRL